MSVQQNVLTTPGPRAVEVPPVGNMIGPENLNSTTRNAEASIPDLNSWTRNTKTPASVNTSVGSGNLCAIGPVNLVGVRNGDASTSGNKLTTPDLNAVARNLKTPTPTRPGNFRYIEASTPVSTGIDLRQNTSIEPPEKITNEDITTGHDLTLPKKVTEKASRNDSSKNSNVMQQNQADTEIEVIQLD